MKFKLALALFSFLILAAFPSSASAQYNPAKDNPYVHVGNSDSKKWYEFYKQEKQSPYTTKNAGYWRTVKEEDNLLTQGVKYFAENIWKAAKALV